MKFEDVELILIQEVIQRILNNSVYDPAAKFWSTTESLLLSFNDNHKALFENIITKIDKNCLIKRCSICGKRYKAKRTDSKYCSNSCKQKRYRLLRLSKYK